MTRTSITIDSRAQQLALHLASAAHIANAMANDALALDDTALAAWLNSGDAAAQPAAFEAHGLLGEAINAAAAVAGAMLAQWGVAVNIPAVDVRPVAEKLAGQYRAIDLDQATGQFVVMQLPRPEPTPDPAPDAADR
jgi:hypothetical protein